MKKPDPDIVDRSIRCTFNISADEEQLLRLAAKRQSLPLATYIRHCAVLQARREMETDREVEA